MKAAQLSSSAGCGHVASFSSFPPTLLIQEEEAAPDLITLISTLKMHSRPACARFVPSTVVLWLKSLSLVLGV